MTPFNIEDPTIASNSVTSILVGNEQRLGNIIAIRIWHNNMGESPNWFLQRVAVEDLQTGQLYAFVVSKWFAGDMDIGTCDRILIPSTHAMHSYPFQFMTEIMTQRRNHNIFLSIGKCSRSDAVRCTYYERATIMTLYLALLSLFHAMFYGQINIRYEAQVDYFSFNYRPGYKNTPFFLNRALKCKLHYAA